MRVYAAIRLTEGREWIDTGTISLLPDQTREVAEATDRSIPGWARVNPVQRVAEVELIEVQNEQPSKAQRDASKRVKAKSAGPIMRDGMDITDIVREWERSRDQFATKNTDLPNPRYATCDKLVGKQIQAAMASVMNHGEPATVIVKNGNRANTTSEIIVRRRAS